MRSILIKFGKISSEIELWFQIWFTYIVHKLRERNFWPLITQHSVDSAQSAIRRSKAMVLRFPKWHIPLKTVEGAEWYSKELSKLGTPYSWAQQQPMYAKMQGEKYRTPEVRLYDGFLEEKEKLSISNSWGSKYTRWKMLVTFCQKIFITTLGILSWPDVFSALNDISAQWGKFWVLRQLLWHTRAPSSKI